MQTSRFSTQFLVNYMKSTCFTNVPKCSDQQNKFQIQFSSRNYFPKCIIFYMYMGTPSKVTHIKYAVAETHISSVRLITVIHVLKLFLRPLLTMYFFALSSRFQTHADQLLDVKSRCYCTTSSHMMSTSPGLPLALDQY